MICTKVFRIKKIETFSAIALDRLWGKYTSNKKQTHRKTGYGVSLWWVKITKIAVATTTTT